MLTGFDAFAYFGMLVVGAVVVAVVGAALLIATVFIVAYFPKLHAGRPKYPCEFRCYDTREIITRKVGEVSEPTGGQLRTIQHLDLRWWIGLSSRNSSRWFLGLLRWERHQ